MKKSKFTESKIFEKLKKAESGISARDICREYAISAATFYKWKAKYRGLDISMMRHLRELEDENMRLKCMYVNSQMDNEILKETLKKALKPSQVKPLVAWAIEKWHCSERRICFLYGVQCSTIRRKSNISDTKQKITDLLMQLADKYNRWGFGLMFKWRRAQVYT